MAPLCLQWKMFNYISNLFLYPLPQRGNVFASFVAKRLQNPHEKVSGLNNAKQSFAKFPIIPKDSLLQVRYN